MLIGEHPVGSPPGVGDSYVENTKSYTMDQYVVFTGVEPLDPEGFRYSLNRNAGLYILAQLSKAFDMGYASSSADISKTYMMSTNLLNAQKGYLFDVILRPSYEATIASTSVINALIWSYAEMFDAVWRQMDTMSTALKLESAQGSDLDDAWGAIYDLPRIYLEDDTSYRDRLKTRTIILNSSGTIANCEAILDSVIGSTSSVITTRYPAAVDITFTTIDAMRVAREKASTLAIIIPEMLASGISYNLFLPFIDYTCDIVMNGPLYLPYNVYLAIKKRNTEKTFEMSYTQNIQTHLNYDMDNLVSDTHIKSMIVGSMFQKYFAESYSMDNVLFKIITKTWQKDIIVKKNAIPKPLTMKSYFQKFNVEKSFGIDQVSKSTKIRRLSLGLNNVFQKMATLDQDIIIRLFAATFNMDILTERVFPKRYGMTIELVGA